MVTLSASFCSSHARSDLAAKRKWLRFISKRSDWLSTNKKRRSLSHSVTSTQWLHVTLHTTAKHKQHHSVWIQLHTVHSPLFFSVLQFKVTHTHWKRSENENKIDLKSGKPYSDLDGSNAARNNTWPVLNHLLENNNADNNAMFCFGFVCVFFSSLVRFCM